jgi:galactose mutarotase-like enzyme
MFTIENDQLCISINSKGAELQSIFHKEHELEYMWSADPVFWGKRSPVLFPIVGTLKENTYFHKAKSYPLSRHGFAREMNFSVETQKRNSITFCIQHTEETLKVYPFRFHFYIRYALMQDVLSVTYGVWNKGAENLFFSVGGHPAFKVPLAEGTSYEDYQLRFNKTESAGRWPISREGLIGKVPLPLLQDSDTINLNKELFLQDAIVLKHLLSDTVKLCSTKTSHGIDFLFSGFPFLGLWAAPGADFLCIEPWCGIADSVDTNQQIEDKEGIIPLQPEELFEATWKARFF